MAPLMGAAIDEARQDLGKRRLFAHCGRLVSTLNGPCGSPPWTSQLGGKRTSAKSPVISGFDVNLPLQIGGLGRFSWAVSTPTRVDSGRTGGRAKAAVPLRARNKSHRPKRKSPSFPPRVPVSSTG
jgi:hypothetical protein